MLMDGRTDRRTEGQTDKQTDGWTNEQTDRWINGQAHFFFQKQSKPGHICGPITKQSTDMAN